MHCANQVSSKNLYEVYCSGSPLKKYNPEEPQRDRPRVNTRSGAAGDHMWVYVQWVHVRTDSCILWDMGATWDHCPRCPPLPCACMLACSKQEVDELMQGGRGEHGGHGSGAWEHAGQQMVASLAPLVTQQHALPM